jgi:hypothetical protein
MKLSNYLCTTAADVLRVETTPGQLGEQLALPASLRPDAPHSSHAFDRLLRVIANRP